MTYAVTQDGRFIAGFPDKPRAQTFLDWLTRRTPAPDVRIVPLREGEQ